MKKIPLFTLIIVIAFFSFIFTECKQNTSKSNEEKFSTVGSWDYKIAKDNCTLILLFNNQNKEFYVRDIMSNAERTYVDTTRIVQVDKEDEETYKIVFPNVSNTDNYELKTNKGNLIWHCKGYSDETLKAKKYNSKLFLSSFSINKKLGNEKY